METACCASAGYNPDEATSIFEQVDVDQGGSVSLEEFEIW